MLEHRLGTAGDLGRPARDCRSADTPTTADEPSTAKADADLARAVLVRRLAAQLRAAIGDRSWLLVIDDAQWCDPLSLVAVEALVPSLRSAPIGVLATVREAGTETAERVAVLSRVGRHLVVPPLTEAALAKLAVEMTGRPLSRSAVARLKDRTAGNVLFAHELLASADFDEIVDRNVVGPATSRATSMFAARIGSLSPECQLALHAASVIGRRFRLDALAEALGRDVQSLLDVVDEARLAGLVRESGIGACEFSHPLIVEACQATIPFPRRVRLHRDVGEALERLRDRGLAVPAAELAHQFASAASAGVPEKAVTHAAAAGRESMVQLAYEDAARDFALALAARTLPDRRGSTRRSVARTGRSACGGR